MIELELFHSKLFHLELFHGGLCVTALRCHQGMISLPSRYHRSTLKLVLVAWGYFKTRFSIRGFDETSFNTPPSPSMLKFEEL